MGICYGVYLSDLVFNYLWIDTMKYELKKFDFYISQLSEISRVVSGYAIKCDLPYRWVLHDDFWNGWTISHFDTGLRVHDAHETQEKVLQDAFKKIQEKIKDGKYENLLHRYSIL